MHEQNPKNSLQSYRLVLVSPMYAGNVGACARLAANFDLKDFWIVSPLCDWRTGEAELYAKGPARDYLKLIRETHSLREALSDCTAAVAFSRRTGAKRVADIELSQLPEVGSKTALVFGREDGGLSHEELLLCSHLCRFATSEVMPSLNLSHSVAIVLSRIFEASVISPTVGSSSEQVSLGEFEELMDHWKKAMIDAEIVHGGNPDRLLEPIRQVLKRSRLNSQEVSVFRAYLSKTQVKLKR